MSAGGPEWSGTTHTSGVWFEYTGACIPVYDLTTVSSMVENIYVHPRSVQNHPFLTSVREEQFLIFGSESDSNGQVYSMQVYSVWPSDGLL